MDELSAALDADAAAPDASAPDAVAEEPAADVAGEPVVDAPPAVATPDPAAVAAAPALPEGVKLRTIEGVKQWVLDPKLGESMAARAGLVDSAEAILGEPLTEDSLRFRQNVVEGFEGMRGDLLSNDPADQANVAKHFEDVINRARQGGEIGHDALASFANVVLDRALSGDPATAQAVEAHITRTVVDRLYGEALRTHDPVQAKTLWSSAQQADKASFGKYRPLKDFDEGRKAAPPARFQPRQEPAAPAGNGAPPAEARAQQEYQNWSRGANEKIDTSAVQGTVDQNLSHIPQEQRKEFPGLYDATRDQLLKAVRTGFKTDSQLQEQVQTLQKRARLAVNPELRNQIADEIVRRYATKAAQILKDKKGPILSEYAKLVAAKSTDQAKRVNAGANAGRNAAPGGGPSAARSNPQAPKTAKFESADDQNFNKELEAAFG